MIPWRLQFSGIRDYPPTSLNLTGDRDHVLITGPNGSGKSTITFCMGAVLYSSKVDMDGLRSRNLPADQTWVAKISFLFKNAGLMKIDAPQYVEFTLKMVQVPGQPIKKEFIIASGDRVDEWEETIKYTSGDRTFNFSTYKKDLQFKYKVDPDLYYLIWYQQEVNQFAIMHPEERFRIYSEMYGIDKVQRDWEESMEKVKETEETVRIAETNVKIMKTELSIKKTALDRFLDNQRRMHQGAKTYIESLLQLEHVYKIEIEKFEEWVQQLKEQIDGANDDLIVKEGLKNRSQEELEQLQQQSKELDKRVETEKQLLDETEVKIEQLQSRMDQLNEELQSITKRKNQLTRTEDEVKEELQILSVEKKKTKEKLEEIERFLKNVNVNWEAKVNKIAQLEHHIKTENKLELEHRERLARFKSSYAVQDYMNQLEKKIRGYKDEQYQLQRQQGELNEEWKLLQEDKDLTARQLESMKYFQSRKIKAFPLRELIELDDRAQPRNELLFDTIKYTIFFNGKEATPPNDLYHVPLMKVVPDRVITHLPSLHLKIKEGVHEEEQTYAIKALWWVEQFFKEGTFEIKNGILRDPLGYRGPQEKERYILSVKALKTRKMEVEKGLKDINSKLVYLDVEIGKDTKSLQELNSIIHQVKQSEAFMTLEHERVLRKQTLKEEKCEKQKLEDERQSLESKKNDLFKKMAEQQHLEQILQEEEAVYVELGKLKGKYEERNQVQHQLEEEKKFLGMQRKKLEQLDNDLYQINQQISKMERNISNMRMSIEDAIRNISSFQKQKNRYMEDKESVQSELVQVMKELEDIKQLIAEIYLKMAETVSLVQLPSIAQLKQNRENGKIIFDQARTESDIDPAAPENYEAVKQEYERLDSEYKRTTILLEQDKERMET